MESSLPISMSWDGCECGTMRICTIVMGSTNLHSSVHAVKYTYIHIRTYIHNTVKFLPQRVPHPFVIAAA